MKNWPEIISKPPFSVTQNMPLEYANEGVCLLCVLKPFSVLSVVRLCFAALHLPLKLANHAIERPQRKVRLLLIDQQRRAQPQRRVA